MTDMNKGAEPIDIKSGGLDSNVRNVRHALEYLEAVIRARCDIHFGKFEDDDAPALPDLAYDGDRSVFSKFIEEKSPTFDEYVTLLLALAPHVAPNLIDRVVRDAIPESGEFPELGGYRDEDRVFVPTGETAIFLLAGNDIQRRREVQALFLPDHWFAAEEVLSLEPCPPGKPLLRGRLLLDPDYVELFTLGRMTAPAYSASFPARPIETRLEWDDLILRDEVRAQVEEISNWIEHNDKIMLDSRMRAKLKPGYRALFHGAPGTGKTLTASLIGRYSGRQVFRIDLSMVVSKYIGETEKNLESLFDRAEHRNWILFFDEADALFGKRTDVEDSHDKYANQDASYLLQRVEDFDGLIILASNLETNLDEAFLRRLNQVIRFPTPNERERVALWRILLPGEAHIRQEADLARAFAPYELTGGNIQNVVHRACLRAVSRGGVPTISVDDVEQAIRAEIEKSGKVFKPLALDLHDNTTRSGTAAGVSKDKANE